MDNDRTSHSIPAWIAAVRALPEAIFALAGTLLTLACAQVIAPGPGSAVLAVVLSLSLARSRLDRDRRGRIEVAIALPLVGLAATGVGWLLREQAVFGAMAFTLGITLSVWLRQFGQPYRRAARLLALPFITVLTVPHVARAEAGPLPATLVPVIVALLALAWVSLLDALGRRLGWLPTPPVASLAHAPQRQGAASTPWRSATTRLAVQMAAALGLAFGVGHGVFGPHWPWVVITAFIVHSGNRGRGEVAWKSLLRVGGAAIGTMGAAALAFAAPGSGQATPTLILVALFLGTWLRPLNYAWWALFVTLALALLQGYAGHPADAGMLERLAAIATGAVLGVAVAWVVLPLRSGDVLRRRLADALALLGELFDPAATAADHEPQRLEQAFASVAELAAPFRAARRIGHPAPAGWIDALAACRGPAFKLLASSDAPPAVRRAIGRARKALRAPAELLDALEILQRTLAEASGDSDPVPAPTSEQAG